MRQSHIWLCIDLNRGDRSAETALHSLSTVTYLFEVEFLLEALLGMRKNEAPPD